MDGRERAWFRASKNHGWHVLSARDDLVLRAMCGYLRSWVTSEQTRAPDPPGRGCARCLNAIGIEPTSG